MYISKFKTYLCDTKSISFVCLFIVKASKPKRYFNLKIFIISIMYLHTQTPDMKIVIFVMSNILILSI